MPRRIDRTEFNFVPSWRIDGPSRGPPLTDSPLHSPSRPLGEVTSNTTTSAASVPSPIGPQCLEQAMRVGGEGGVDQA
jgi:hypothetical protein